MIRTVAIGALSAALLAGSAGGAERAPVAAPEDVRVGVVLNALDNPFFLAIYEGARAQSARLRAATTFRSVTSNAELEAQAAQVGKARAARADCYVVNPITATNLRAALRGVRAPIVNVDSPVAGVPVTTYIGTDDFAAGRLAGRRMASLLPDGGEIALIGGIADNVNSGLRLSGFQRGIQASPLRVAVRVNADYDRTKAEIAAGRILRAHPRLAGFFAASDNMALGVADALRAAGRSGVVRVIGLDGIAEAMDAVRAGGLDATVAQYPYVMGEMAIEACAAAARGAKLPARADAPIALLTRDNVDRAIASFPKPVATYPDPFAHLVMP
jgi:ABC-type sugar transport system substrate-binding protein